MTDPRPLGIDTGYFKGTFAEHNWTALPQDVVFVLPCFGSGTWVEPKAAEYVAELEMRQKLWAPWYFPYAHIEPKVLVAAWLKTPKPHHFPRCVDYERSPKYNSIPSASHLLETVDRIEQADGNAAMVYSRKELIDKFLATMSTEDLNRLWWYLAQYFGDSTVEDVRPIILPLRVRRDRILFHQTADRVTPFPGFYTHVPPPKYMDTDRWVGVTPIDVFAGAPNPPPAATIEERVAALETRVTALETP
jgi:hypothetical protein